MFIYSLHSVYIDELIYLSVTVLDSIFYTSNLWDGKLELRTYHNCALFRANAMTHNLLVGQVAEEVCLLNFIVSLSFSGYWLILITNWSLVESFKWFSLTNFSVMGAAVGQTDIAMFLALCTRDQNVCEWAWSKEIRVRVLLYLIARVDIKQNG